MNSLNSQKDWVHRIPTPECACLPELVARLLPVNETGNQHISSAVTVQTTHVRILMCSSPGNFLYFICFIRGYGPRRQSPAVFLFNYPCRSGTKEMFHRKRASQACKDVRILTCSIPTPASSPWEGTPSVQHPPECVSCRH